MNWSVNPLRGNQTKPLTGEPCAGNPPARFGGGRGRNQSVLPTPINVGLHRQTPEIVQVLTTMTGGRGEPVEVIFTPHLVPMDRGIFATIHARPRQPAVEHDLLGLYRSFYARSPFIRVVGHLPATKDSAYTNYCDITLRVLRGQIVILACLDNLIKGA